MEEHLPGFLRFFLVYRMFLRRLDSSSPRLESSESLSDIAPYINKVGFSPARAQGFTQRRALRLGATEINIFPTTLSDY